MSLSLLEKTTNKNEAIQTNESPIQIKNTIGSTDISRIRSEMNKENKLSSERLEYISPRDRTRPFSIEDAMVILDRLIETDDHKSGTYSKLTGKSFSQQTKNEIVAGIIRPEVQETFNSIQKLTNDYFETVNPQNYEQDETWVHQISGRPKEKASLRIYLKPKLAETYNVWGNIISLLESNKEIKESGFISKIANIGSTNLSELLECWKQDDRMLFYFTKEIEDKAIRLIQDYISGNPEKFEPTFSLATPLIDDKGKNLDCAFAADEIEDIPEKTLNNFYYTKILPSVIRKFCDGASKTGDYLRLRDLMESIKRNPNAKAKLAQYLVVTIPELTKEYGFTSESTAFRKVREDKAELN